MNENTHDSVEIEDDGKEVHYHITNETPTAGETFVGTLAALAATAVVGGVVLGGITLADKALDKIKSERKIRKEIKAEVRARHAKNQ